MSMYSDYLTERTDDQIIECEEGFATYRFTDEKTCYIIDIYIAPVYRKRGAASDIADIIMEKAKNKGCTKLLGSVVPSTKGSNESIKVLQAYGMKLDSSANDFILFSREIS